jgi:hypothetical protein
VKHARGLTRAFLVIIAVPLLAGCSVSLESIDPSAPADGTEMPLGPPSGAEMVAAGVWKCPKNLTGAYLIASIDGDTYYWPDCGQAKNIELENRICFESADAARAYGLRPCNSCP